MRNWQARRLLIQGKDVISAFSVSCLPTVNGERACEIGRLSCDGQMSAFRRALVLHVEPVSGGMTGTTDAAPHYFESSLAAEERAPSELEERCWRWAGLRRAPVLANCHVSL